MTGRMNHGVETHDKQKNPNISKRGKKKQRVTGVSLERALLSSIGQERGRGSADSALL